MDDDLRDTYLSTIEASLEAQLRAVRRLRKQPEQTESTRQGKSMSQVDMAFDILVRARAPLHVSEIIDRIQKHFGVSIDRESLVSSLSKKVARKDRFVRPEKNTFSLR
jgi:DNA-directed RNA polymerase delta subunit